MTYGSAKDLPDRRKKIKNIPAYKTAGCLSKNR